MNECKLTEFGLAVKTKLLQIGQSQRWLEKKVSESTGLYVDRGYLYKVFTGQRNSRKIVDAIKEILGMEADHEGTD